MRSLRAPPSNLQTLLLILAHRQVEAVRAGGSSWPTLQKTRTQLRAPRGTHGTEQNPTQHQCLHHSPTEITTREATRYLTFALLLLKLTLKFQVFSPPIGPASRVSPALPSLTRAPNSTEVGATPPPATPAQVSYHPPLHLSLLLFIFNIFIQIQIQILS